MGRFKVIDSLDDIIKILKTIDLTTLNDKQLINLSKNYEWTNKKVREYNQGIESNFITYGINELFQFLSDGERRLTSQMLDDQIQTIDNHFKEKIYGEGKLIQIDQDHTLLNNPSSKSELIDFFTKFELSEDSIFHFIQLWIDFPQDLKENTKITSIFSSLPLETRTALISKLPEEKKITYLLNADDQIFLDYYNENPFLRDVHLVDPSFKNSDSTIKENQMEILLRLIRLNHNQTIREVQNTPLLRKVLILELENHLNMMEPKTGDHHIMQALQRLDMIEKFISQENLLQILIFVNKNRELMASGNIGLKPENRPSIRKIKLPSIIQPGSNLKLEYDVSKGDLIINLGFLGQGNFKVVKKRLLLSSPGLPMQAIAKQDMSSELGETMSIREREILKLAKGSPHVITLHEATEYTSKKKQIKQSVTIYPLYNMGELKHLNSSTFSEKEKYQITAEIIKGLLGLHERRIIHRDIKPANIFLDKSLENSKEVIHAFIGDLGLACLENSPDRENFAGTSKYLPPHMSLHKGGKSDYGMDVWALGITLCEFFTGTSPMASATTDTERITIGYKLGDWAANPPPTNENCIEYIIWKLMQPKISERMTLKEALFKVEKLIASAS